MTNDQSSLLTEPLAPCFARSHEVPKSCTVHLTRCLCDARSCCALPDAVWPAAAERAAQQRSCCNSRQATHRQAMQLKAATQGKLRVHLTRCLRTLRARLLRSHSVAARGAREGPWSGQAARAAANCKAANLSNLWWPRAARAKGSG